MPNISYRCCSRARFGQGFFRQPLLHVSVLPRSPQLADAPLHPRSRTTVLGEGCPPCSVGARWVLGGCTVSPHRWRPQLLVLSRGRIGSPAQASPSSRSSGARGGREVPAEVLDEVRLGLRQDAVNDRRGDPALWERKHPHPRIWSRWVKESWGRPAPRGGGRVCTQGMRTPCCPTPSERGGTCLQVHAEEPGEAGTVGVPRQWLQDDAAQPGLGPAAGQGSRQ